METVHIVIDENAIASQDASAIIEPVWWTADIYGTYGDYMASLARFSRGQCLLLAVSCYAAEVNNGGHGQFYLNSTGIVWEDALAGLGEIGLPEVAAVLAESAKRMGGRPPFDREVRIRTLKDGKPKFDDLDDRFYNLDADLDAKMLAYIRAHPKDFLFDGEIKRPKLPR